MTTAGRAPHIQIQHQALTQQQALHRLQPTLQLASADKHGGQQGAGGRQLLHQPPGQGLLLWGYWLGSRALLLGCCHCQIHGPC